MTAAIQQRSPSHPNDKDDQVNKDDRKNRNSVCYPSGVRPWRAAGVAAALAVTALLAAACGGAGSHASGSGSSSGQNFAVALDSFASCMRSHGAPGFYFARQTGTPSPPPDGLVMDIHGNTAEFDLSSPVFKAAEKKCQHLAPFSLTPFSGESHKQFLEALKSAECMRSHGYPDWPDPNPTAGQVTPVGVETNSPQFQSAAKTCGESP